MTKTLLPTFLALLLIALGAACVNQTTPTSIPTPEPPPALEPASLPPVTPSPAVTPPPTPTPTQRWSPWNPEMPITPPTPTQSWSPWDQTIPTTRSSPTPEPTTPIQTPPPTPLATPDTADLAKQCREALAENWEEIDGIYNDDPTQIASDDIATCVSAIGHPNTGITSVADYIEMAKTWDFSLSLNSIAAAYSDDSGQQGAQTSNLPTTGSPSSSYTLLSFSCTGSMEPTITCEDEAYGAVPSGPESIAVGDIITFSSPADCLNGNIVHRVVAIEIVDGAYFYQTQGDASATPDPCLVPFSAVGYRVVDIISGNSDDPRIVQLRGRVNTAKDAMDAAESAYNTARDETIRLAAETDAKAAEVSKLAKASDHASELADEAWDDYTLAIAVNDPFAWLYYQDYLDAHEAWLDAYDLWESAHAEWTSLYAKWQESYAEAERLYAAYEDAVSTWECWVDHARNNNYDGEC